MSFFNEANKEAYSVSQDNTAQAPWVGPLDSFNVSYQTQVRTQAQYGIEAELFAQDREQRKRLNDAGLPDVAISPVSTDWREAYSLGPGSDAGAYTSTYRLYSGSGRVDPEYSERISRYDEEIEKIKETRPDLNLRTSREMFEDVRKRAEEYERRDATDRRTVAGHIGAFLGGVAGQFNPQRSPLNVITAPIGGLGKTAFGRIGGEALVGGASEALNQVTGVQEQRQALGLDYGFANAASNIIGGAVGGAALQGAGEAAGFAFRKARRWFDRNPIDAPPSPLDLGNTPQPLADVTDVPRGVVPEDSEIGGAVLVRDPERIVYELMNKAPDGGSRAGRARSVIDLDYVDAQLTDWSGPAPWELRPKTDVTPIPEFGEYKLPDTEGATEKDRIDVRARQIDPEIFSRYDNLLAKKEAARAGLSDVDKLRSEEIALRLEEIDRTQYELARKGRGEQRVAKQRSLRNEVKALTEERNRLEAGLPGNETPTKAEARRNIMRYDEKLRDVAPLIGRAYARARGEWENSPADLAAIYDMVRNGKSNPVFTKEAAKRIVNSAEASYTDMIPMLKRVDTVADKLPSNADVVDMARAVVAHDVKLTDEAADLFGANISRLLATEGGDIEIPGYAQRLNLDNDTISVPNEDGTGEKTITVREFLEDVKQSQDELQAVSTCSLQNVS